MARAAHDIWIQAEALTHKGAKPSRAPPGAGFASDPDLGSGCSIARIPGRSAPAIACCCCKPPCSRGSSLRRFDFRLASGMRRGEVWTVAGAGDCAGKPRPVVIVQDDSFEGVDSLVVCPFTSDRTEAPLFRLPVEPNPSNGLRAACQLMVDKITAVPKSKTGQRIGSLDVEDIVRLNR